MNKPDHERLHCLETAAQIFYDKVFSDPMIGFMFVGLDACHLARREWELMARTCGLDVEYQGRPLAQAHRRHRIRRGQFNRRMVLLKAALLQAGVCEGDMTKILHHNERLAPMILGQALQDPHCDHPDDGESLPGVKVYS